MSIKIFGFGGFGETGKNMYAILNDGKYFILDAGIKYPSNELYGIDEIIPDFSVLQRIKNNVCGFFISNAHDDHIGALVYILKELKINVYATKLAIELIRDSLDEAGIDFPNELLKTISIDDELDFGSTKISYFRTTNSIPESVGICLKTENGNIVYTGEFTFDQGDDPLYRTDFKKINEIAKDKNLALLVESRGAKRDVQIGFEKLFNHEIDNIFQDAKGRIIFSLYSSDLLKIQKIINTAISNNKKIAILGRKAQRLVDISIQNKYLDIPKESFTKLSFIDQNNNNKDENLVILVTGNRHEPFYMLQRMAKKIDKLIHLHKNDTVVVLTPPVPGTEKISSRTLDILYRYDITVKKIKEDLLSTSHATSAEVKMMINLLNPKYLIPVIGEYQHQIAVKKIGNSLGYEDKNIFILENGDILDIDNTTNNLLKKEIPTGDILIDGTPIYDKNDIIIKDRELLALDGVIILSVNIFKNSNQIAGDIVLETNGFFNPPEHDKFLLELKNNFKSLIDMMLKKPRRLWNDEKRKIRSNLAFFIENKANRNPVLIIQINDL